MIPQAFVGEFPLSLDPTRILVLVGTRNVLPAAAEARADGMLPGHVLARHHVVLDYPAARFTIGRPGALLPQGEAWPMPVAIPSGFPRTELEVDGKTYGFLLDTGAAFTRVSELLLEEWGRAHPDWPRHPGAHGEARRLGGQTLETLYVPEARWGTRTVAPFGVTSQRAGTFEQSMSALTTAPVVGALAGNVLTRFRVELDYAAGKLYLSAP